MTIASQTGGKAKMTCEVNSSLGELGGVLSYYTIPAARQRTMIARKNAGKMLLDPEEMADGLTRWDRWHTEMLYATSDNQPHPLRETLLQYIDLPPILPHPGPNDNPITELDGWLRPCLEGLAASVGEETMSDRRLKPALDLQGMSIK
jgi:hypothetical protein